MYVLTVTDAFLENKIIPKTTRCKQAIVRSLEFKSFLSTFVAICTDRFLESLSYTSIQMLFLIRIAKQSQFLPLKQPLVSNITLYGSITLYGYWLP